MHQDIGHFSLSNSRHPKDFDLNLVNIVDMESDLVLEVPETPERPAQLAGESSSHPSRRKNISVEVDPLSKHQDLSHFSITNSHHPKDFDARDVSATSTTTANSQSSQGKLTNLLSENLHKRPLLRSFFEVGQREVSTDSEERVERTGMNCDTRAISKNAKRNTWEGPLGENSEFLRSHASSALLGIGSSLPAVSVVRPRNQIGITIFDKEKTILQGDACADTKSRDKGKEVNLYSDSQSKFHEELLSAMQTNVSKRPRPQRRTSISSEVHFQNRMTSSDGRKCSPFAGISDQNNLKGIFIQDNLQPRNSRRKLVNNGRISQNNNLDSWSIRKTTENELEEIAFIGMQNTIGTSHPILNGSPDYRGRYGDNIKGKAIADASKVTNGQHNKPNLPLSRPYEAARENVTVYGDCDNYNPSFADLRWWTHSQTQKEPTVSSTEADSIYRREDMSGHSSDKRNDDVTGTRNHLNILQDNSATFVLPGSNLSAERPSSHLDSESSRKKCKERKRKYGSTSSSRGESSSSAYDVPEVSYIGTSRRSFKSRSTRTLSHRLRSIIIVPIKEVDELPRVEIRDSNLQQQCHSVSDSFDARDRQVESDELLAQQLQEELYNESPETRKREEIDAAIAWSLQQEENARHASLFSGQTQHSHMFNLQELETGINSGTHMPNILHIQHDFNGNDYEMLSALDDNNHQHTGASESQINNLPQSIVQTDNAQEPCAICLEKLSVGEMIKHLPCFHKFHKDCIDRWLRRKTLCPVCKSGI